MIASNSFQGRSLNLEAPLDLIQREFLRNSLDEMTNSSDNESIDRHQTRRLSETLQEQNGNPVKHLSRRSSLVNDAKLETARNKIVQEQLVKELQKDEAKYFDLTEEEILLLSQIVDINSSNKTVTNLMFSIPEDLQQLTTILNHIDICEGRIEHLETRHSMKCNSNVDVLIKLEIRRNSLMKLIKSIRRSGTITISVISTEKLYLKEIWFPKQISELDKCSHVLSKFEPDLDNSHPGFSDVAYRSRRKEIAQIGFEYKYGHPIPTVNYTEEEIKTWGIVYKKMCSLLPKYACKSYQKALKLLEDEGIYRPDAIPQLQDVSTFLKKSSGFTLRPTAGLVSARDFLASLAFRVFQCTQYIRHSSSPHHTPEPDCIHELMGHIPMFADPTFAKFSQEIGLASLGASDEEIEKLATVYWFTVEFGLCKESDEIKAYGAALLSSYGELLHSMSDKPQLLPFDPNITSVQPYQDQDYQDVYFVAQSFEDAIDKVRNYVNNHMNRQYNVAYDPYTESIIEIDSLKKLRTLIDSMASDFSSLSAAVRRFS